MLVSNTPRTALEKCTVGLFLASIQHHLLRFSEELLSRLVINNKGGGKNHSFVGGVCVLREVPSHIWIHTPTGSSESGGKTKHNQRVYYDTNTLNVTDLSEYIYI